jgi:hypothetical protein
MWQVVRRGINLIGTKLDRDESVQGNGQGITPAVINEKKMIPS